jgi:hypothetical protein
MSNAERRSHDGIDRVVLYSNERNIARNILIHDPNVTLLG